MKYCLAIDIGHLCTKHVIGYEKDGGIVTDEVYSFDGYLEEAEGSFIWNTEKIFAEVLSGIRAAFKKYPEIESIAIDGFGSDYVLLSDDEEISPTYAYCDKRTGLAVEEVHKIIPFKTLYEHTGTCYRSYNSLYQLYVDKEWGRLDGATDFLMIPEYITYRLTGKRLREFTGATTTGMVNADTLRYDRKIWSSLGLPISLDENLSAPGTLVGSLKADVAKSVGGDAAVVLVATNNVASALLAVDMTENAPYIVREGASVVGIKTSTVHIDDKSLDSGYSNEGGFGYNRYEKNVTGMGVIENLRSELCPEASLDDTVKMAEESSFFDNVDLGEEEFSYAKSIKSAIDLYMTREKRELPRTVGDYFRCAYFSLAHCYGVAINELEYNTGRAYNEIYVIGGEENAYLNKLTERYTRKRVIPIDKNAAAMGNIKVQIKRK